MRRFLILAGALLFIQLLPLTGWAQDKLEGRWEGKTQSPQGERPTTAVFKKEGSGYTGTITGMRGDLPLKEVKVDGDKVTAKAEVQAQGNTITINYSLKLQGDSLKGTGAVDFSGQTFEFDVDLKRASAGASAAVPSATRSETPSANADKLAGRWEGKIQAPQGERETNLVIRKEGDKYSGKMPSLRPGEEIELKDFKLDGNKVTAKADIETPQGGLTINYIFTLEGETMKGQGTADFGGQSFTIDINLNRVSSGATGAPPTGSSQGQASAGQAQGQGQGQRQRPPSVAQPQQKQSIDYFIGQWDYKYIGRESALGPAPRECTVNFTKRADGKSVEGVTNCKHEGGAYQSSAVIVFDEAAKTLAFSEKLTGGVTINSRGDWSTPISIRFTVDPIKVKGQSLQLRRTISIVSAHSFTVAEELSEDGGPFVRLGSAVFSKAAVQ